MSEPIAELREVVARTEPVPAALTAYLATVRHRAFATTDADVAALKSSGFSEDTIFEQTVAVAIAEGLRRLDAADRVIG